MKNTIQFHNGTQDISYMTIKFEGELCMYYSKIHNQQVTVNIKDIDYIIPRQ